MIEFQQTDLFKADCHGIAHQVNGRGVWGAGLAKEMKKRFPRSYLVDNLTLVNNPKKLGTFNYAAPADDQNKWIFNICGQFNYGKDKQYTDYSALNSAFESLRDFLIKMDFNRTNFDGVFILAIPFGLGAGLGGGQWSKVLSIINYHFKDCEDIKLLICKKD